ncbi:MmgE/PrpD family protein [Paraburkholderia sp. LEh10]|uniref:MmgE/PrpD family protein n=1 Tax=Paraburkholderia sp. LEh10 TaxID=2821353 RepID=UPI001AE254B4|nr:MmgE/PrpD family protein [Paraburkholderia sp. LEh10]MBP0588399.1 MmgE/PrpD family protein [Paraburkholderia sp. LEh10]
MSSVDTPRAMARLGEFAASLRDGDIPVAVRQHAAVVLADTVGACMAGARAPELHALIANAPPGSALMLGTGARTIPGHAALFNGAAGTWVELDEGHYGSGGHPAIHVTPAALAVAEQRAASGAALITALVLGYEVAARIGAASRLRPEVHPHGTWGGCGGALAAGKLLGFDEEQSTRVLAISASTALATSRQAPLEGGTIRNLYAGIAGANALLCCTLTEAGVTGGSHDLETIFGRVLGERFDEGKLVEGLGSHWMVTENFMKRHACCRDTQGALEALNVALAPSTWHPKLFRRVREIRLYVPPAARAMDNVEPVNTIAAKFSIPFVVATWLYHGHADIEAFEAQAVANADIRSLARRVSLVVLSSGDPADALRTRIEMTLDNGEILRGEAARYMGDFDRPFAPDVLPTKFARLTASYWKQEEARQTFEAITRCDEIADIRELTGSRLQVQCS